MDTREEPPPPAPEPGPAPPGRLRAFVSTWCERPLRAAWEALAVYSAHAWPGFALGAMVLALAASAYAGFQFMSGLGRVPDAVLALVLGGLGLLALGALVLLLRLILVSWPWRFCFGALGSFALLALVCRGMGVPGAFALAGPAVLVLLGGSLGGGVSALLASRISAWRLLASAIGVTLLSAGLSFILVAWLAGPGDDPHLLPPPPPRAAPELKAPDPGAPGLWKTASLCYGSGTDRRRPEFGPGVALRTPFVDGSRLLPEFTGFGARVRSWYWGFGKEALPLNARVTYPQGQGPFPLVLAVHGNHTAQAFSDAGYQYLGELLASHGFIFASVDENFLNGSGTADVPKENGARAWLLLKHLEQWRRWNADPGNPFTGKVDLDNIALIGHSRGGEAAALAAVFNRLPCDPDDAALPFAFGFKIKAVAAIAPCDGQYEPSGLPPALVDTSYFVLQGSHDADVSTFMGARPFRRAQFTGGVHAFKAALWVYRANHGQFNTDWGREDAHPPLSWLLSTGALLAPGDQRRVAKVFLAGFLEATLHGRSEYLPMFRDPEAAAAWLPRTLYLNRFEDEAFRPVATFEGSLDLTRATLPGATLKGENLAVWRQRTVTGRDGWSFRDQAVQLGWVRAGGKVPSYAIALPVLDWEIPASSRLVFSMADTDEDPGPGAKAPGAKGPIDFTLELEAADGTLARVPLSRVRTLQPAVKVRLTKWGRLEDAIYKRAWEPVFQTFEVPLDLFKEAAPAWSPKGLRGIRFIFDRTPRGDVLLDEVGFGS